MGLSRPEKSARPEGRFREGWRGKGATKRNPGRLKVAAWRWNGNDLQQYARKYAKGRMELQNLHPRFESGRRLS
jgi:hypothetical protein